VEHGAKIVQEVSLKTHRDIVAMLATAPDSLTID